MNVKHDGRGALGWIAIALLMALVVQASGCQNQRATYATALDSYTATMNVLSDLRDVGELGPEEEAVVNEWEPVAWLALQQWRVSIEQGDSPPDTAMEQLERAMSVLRDVALQNRREGE